MRTSSDASPPAAWIASRPRSIASSILVASIFKWWRRTFDPSLAGQAGVPIDALGVEIGDYLLIERSPAGDPELRQYQEPSP